MSTLLPPNASTFQRHLEQVNNFGFDGDQAIQTLINLKSDPPEEFLYWLVWEYGLNELLPYKIDLRQLITQGLRWQRLRGTPKSLRIALDWIQVHPVRIEEEPPGVAFYQYQLQLDGIVPQETVDRIQRLADLSSPARSRLSRMYNAEHDIRRLRLSENGFGNYLSDYSGARYGDLRLSFGRFHAYSASLVDPAFSYMRGLIHGIHVKVADVPELGEMRIEDKATLNHQAIRSQASMHEWFSLDGHPMAVTSREWRGSWSGRRWTDGTLLPVEIMRGRTHGCVTLSGPGAISIGDYINIGVSHNGNIN